VFRLLSLVALVLTILPVAGQDVAPIRVMQRVHTAHPYVREVLGQWTDSLREWRDAGPTDTRSQYTAGMASVVKNWFSADPDVVRRYSATVMSVEYDGSGWAVRTLFAQSDVSAKVMIPLGIVRARFVLAPQPAGRIGWVLDDALRDRVAAWDTIRVGRITYHHPPGVMIDTVRALASNRFLDETATRFGQPVPDHVHVFVARDRDEVSALLGVEYHAFPPQAISFPQAGTVFESLPEIQRDHELVHIIFRSFDNAHPILREGLATLLGGTGSLDFPDALGQYLDEREGARIPSFVELFTADGVDEADVYVLGGVLCDLVLRFHGRKALLDLLRIERPSDVMMALSDLLGFDIADRQGSLRSYAETARSRGVTGR